MLKVAVYRKGIFIRDKIWQGLVFDIHQEMTRNKTTINIYDNNIDEEIRIIPESTKIKNILTKYNIYIIPLSSTDIIMANNSEYSLKYLGRTKKVWFKCHDLYYKDFYVYDILNFNKDCEYIFKANKNKSKHNNIFAIFDITEQESHNKSIVKAQYRKLAFKYHSDTSNLDNHDKFIELQNANKILSDSNKLQKYIKMQKLATKIKSTKPSNQDNPEFKFRILNSQTFELQVNKNNHGVAYIGGMYV